MTDNQFYRLNPNNTLYNQQNYPGRIEVVIQGSEMAQYSPPAYVIIYFKNRETTINHRQISLMKATVAHLNFHHNTAPIQIQISQISCFK
jgi:hypothetical protein